VYRLPRRVDEGRSRGDGGLLFTVCCFVVIMHRSWNLEGA
jgi:hypothetical protein